MDHHNIRSSLQISVALRYFTENGDIHNIEVSFDCNLHEFMAWQYLMNSPHQCSKFSNEFSTKRLSVTVLNTGVAINCAVTNESFAINVTGDSLKKVFSKLGKILVVETVDRQEGTMEETVRELNEIFNQELARASVVDKRIFVVFPNSGRECVEKCVKDYKKDKSVTKTIAIERVLKKFPSVLDECFKNANISYKFGEVEKQCFCVMSGHKTCVDTASRNLEQVKADIKFKHITLDKIRQNALKDLNVEDGINESFKTSFPSCVFEQTDKYLRVCSFESNLLTEATDYVENLVCYHVFPIKSNAVHQTGELMRHLKGLFEGKILVGADKCQFYLCGLKPDVEEARSELIDLQEGRKSLNTAMHDDSSMESCTETYNVRNREHIKYFENSVFIGKIEKASNVKICLNPEKYVIEITGDVKNVSKAIKCLTNIGQKLVSDKLIVSQKMGVQYFETESSKDFITSVQIDSDVYIEKKSETIFGDEDLQVTKDEHEDYSKWTLTGKKSLYLEKYSVEDVVADVKIIPVTNDALPDTGAPLVKNQHIVSLDIPEWIDGSQFECRIYNDKLEQIIHELETSGERSVMILIKQIGNWTFHRLMSCTVDFAVKWLLSGTKRKPNTVRLCIDREDFPATDAFLDKRFEKFISDFQNKDKLHISVCEGELDKIKADVLINTTAANLDLSKGHVSAAVLKTAGNDLQRECHKKYRNGIKHGEIAVTRGYNTSCTNIYHMVMQPYSQKSMKECIENLRTAMTLCLQTASDSGFTSVAFPALGTGSLEYPVELVAAEMFGCVERFERDCPDTKLKEIKFVIYFKDVELLEYFRSIEIGGVNTINRYRQIRIEMLGIQDNVNHARKLLEEKVLELDELPAAPKSKVSGNSHSHRVQTNEEYVVHANQKSVYARDNKPKLSLLESSDSKSGNIEKRDDASAFDLQRNEILCKSKFSQCKEVFTCNDCTLRVYTGDVMNAPVDCIVVATNEGLKSCNRNDSFPDKNFEKGANCWIQKRDQTALDVPTNKMVIYAVFPCWDSYKPMTSSNLSICSEYVRRTVLDCLHLAEEKNIRSIAFPSLCSGRFEVPQDVCAIQFAEAVKSFTRNNNIVKDIHFIDDTQDKVKIITNTFKSMICECQQSPYDISRYIEHGASAISINSKLGSKHTGSDDLRKGRQESSNTDVMPHVTSDLNVADNKAFKLCFPSGHTVEVYDADILSLNGVEAIVCSENKYGQAKGMIAKALYRKCDERYRKNKHIEFNSSKKYGDIISIQSETCGFNWVMHAIVSSRENKIQLVYRNVFREAKKRNITSLALSLLGTGKLDVDPVTSAKALLSEIIDFFNDSMNDQFTLHVHVVLNDIETVELVKGIFTAFINDTKKARRIEDKHEESSISTARTLRSHTKDKTDEMKAKSSISTVNPASKDERETTDDCVICMDKVTNEIKLICGHIFCKECIEGYFKVRKVCPTCGKVCGVITGDQPEGMMEVVKRRTQLEGFEGYKSLAITYSFPSGTQGTDHPKPGEKYQGITRTAYLPDNMEGREICTLLKVAFERRLVFTIGTSRTTGREGVITWNDIHHKTDLRPHTQFGYPDKTYLRRVREELEVKGVSKDDIDRKFMKQLDKDKLRLVIN